MDLYEAANDAVKYRDDGFTLIELMVVVVLIGILAAIAYPSYTRYVVETRRADGQAGALQLAAQLEKYFTQCGQCTSAINSGSISACSGLGLPNANSPDGNYAMRVPHPSPGPQSKI